MHGKTQQCWHHRVPRERSRRPRININFRYIVPGTPDADRGQHTYYKYMVHGDDPAPPTFTFAQIAGKRSSVWQFLQKQNSSPRPNTPSKPEAKQPGASSDTPCLDVLERSAKKQCTQAVQAKVSLLAPIMVPEASQSLQIQSNSFPNVSAPAPTNSSSSTSTSNSHKLQQTGLLVYSPEPIRCQASSNQGEQLSQAKPDHTDVESQWACTSCTYLNSFTSSRCEMCTQPSLSLHSRLSSGTGAGKQPGPARQGKRPHRQGQANSEQSLTFKTPSSKQSKTKLQRKPKSSITRYFG